MQLHNSVRSSLRTHQSHETPFRRRSSGVSLLVLPDDCQNTQEGQLLQSCGAPSLRRTGSRRMQLSWKTVLARQFPMAEAFGMRCASMITTPSGALLCCSGRPLRPERACCSVRVRPDTVKLIVQCCLIGNSSEVAIRRGLEEVRRPPEESWPLHVASPYSSAEAQHQRYRKAQHEGTLALNGLACSI